MQGEGGQVKSRWPALGTLEQHGDIVRVDVEPQLLVEQEFGLLLREGELPGAELVQLPHGPESPQRQRRVGAATDDEVNVLGETLHEEGNGLVGLYLGYELIVIEHQHNPTGQLGELVYEHGERRPDERLSHGPQPHEQVGPEILVFRRSPAQRLYYVRP